MIAEVVTPRVGDGLAPETAFRPLLTDRFAVRMEDVTARPAESQPTEPNLLVARIWCDQETFDAIEADPDFEVLLDAPNPKPGNGIPSASEFGRIRAYLARHGVTQATIRDVIGGGPAGRTRAEIADELKTWLRSRPKAVTNG